MSSEPTRKMAPRLLAGDSLRHRSLPQSDSLGQRTAMGKRHKQAKLAVASTGRVELTDGHAKRSGRPERSPSPAIAARLERAKKAQQSSQKSHKPTWRDEQEQGRIVDEGQAIISSSEDEDPGLVESFELVDDEAEEASEDEESSEEEEEGHQRRRRGRAGSDSGSDEQPTPRRAAKSSRRAKEIVLSSDDNDDEEAVARTTPVASTSKSKVSCLALVRILRRKADQ